MHRASQSAPPPQNPPVNYDALLTFDVTSAFQTDWLGISANYELFAAFPELGLTGAQQTAEFDRAYTSGIKMANTWLGQDWAYASYPAGSPDWSSAKMTAFYTAVQAMKDRGINVVVRTGWHFPNDVCGISTPTAPSCTPTPTDENVWKSWVSEVLNQLINVQGLTNVIGAQFFTEPNLVTGTIPGGYTAQQYYAHLVSIAKAQIAADDASRTPILPRIKLIGPSEISFTTADDWTDDLVANNPTLLDVYAAHTYCQIPDFAPFGLVATQCPAYTPWNAMFAGWAGDTTPKPLWSDEGNTLTGGDTDTGGYRQTADAGWQLCRWVDGHMQGGCQASFIWMLQDQTWVGSTPYSQQYGVAQYIGTSTAVKPSWYALSMHANLTGGGGGTRLYRCTGGTSTLHGTAAKVPLGVRNAVNADGEWSFVVINEGVALDVKVIMSSTIGGRTVYRYTYSGEYVWPTTATLTPWDRSFSNVTTAIPTDHIPGRSVVIYSTMNISTPTAANLALTATATTDSYGSGAPHYVTKGNPSNCTGNTNGWKKADNSSHYLELTWGSSQTVGRLELSFVATTAGVVYATYADTTTPSPVADYTVQYWNGSSFVDFSTPVNVSGNAQPNRTHTFTPVSTTKLRLTVTSAAATSQVNNFGVYAS